jgi:phosphatidylglycerophosphatase A
VDLVKLKKVYAPADARPVTPPKGPLDYVALTLATGLFSGYSPVAPGTAGSAVMAGLFYAAVKFGLINPFAVGDFPPLILACLAISYAGVWASTKAIGFFGNKDPNQVTVDEFAGQLITYLFLPLVPRLQTFAGALEAWTVVGFLVFRVFDVFKPYPARQFEALKGGLGVMADDVVAGVQGAIVMLVGARLFLAFQ